jgi:inner membrane protein
LEPVTHFLLGATLSRAGFNRKTALATATMTLAAEAPDIDSLSGLFARSGFAHHRGITHSLVGAPLVAALVLAIVYGWHRWRRRGRQAENSGPRWALLFGLAWLAALSHILLDFTNNYGVRPFAPFSYRWYSWDIVFIYEPVLWAVLVLGLILPSLFALITQEIRSSRRREPRGRWAAIVALAAVVLLWGVRDYEHRRAIAAMEALTYGDQPTWRVRAFPFPVNPFAWYGVAETANAYHRVTVDSLRPEVDPQGAAAIRYKPEETPVTLAAKRSYFGRVYLDWAMFPMTEVERLSAPEAGYVVRFYDIRYEYPGRPSNRRVLSAWVQLDAELRVQNESFGARNMPPRQHGRK